MATETDLKIATAVERVWTETASLRVDMERLRVDMERGFNVQTRWIVTWTTLLVFGAVGFIIQFG